MDNVSKINYIGCTSESVKVRFSNHESHIKRRLKTCELSKHFTENQHLHKINTSTNSLYEKDLAKQLSTIVFKSIDIPCTITSNVDKLKVCKTKEHQWQQKMKTFRDYGVLSIREERRKQIT